MENKNSTKNNKIHPKQKQERIKSEIMAKYNISSDDAEKIILKIEKDNLKSDNTNPKHMNSNVNSDKKEDYNFSDNTLNSQKTAEKVQVNNFNATQNDFSTKYHEKNHDVDEIMADIIPDYNKNLSIELNHVDLTFEVENEKIDTIKESVVNFLKGKSKEKIKIHALKDVSFKIYKGEKVGIIGYNGAGKSTLLKVISGIYPPDKGSVKTHGNISPLLSLGAGFDYNYSGRQNILLSGAVLGYDKELLEKKMDEIIEFSELGKYIDIPIKNYSSGMLAKLGFSIATTVNPDILIIDEVLGVGDVTFRKKSTDKMKSLMDGGTTVLFVSHSIPGVRELCDKAIWIDDGKLREIGEVNKVCDHYLKDAEKATNEQLANIQFR